MRKAGAADPFALVSLCLTACLFTSVLASTGLPRWKYRDEGFELQRKGRVAAPMCLARETVSAAWLAAEPAWSVPARTALNLHPRQRAALLKVSLCRALMKIY